MHHKSEKKLYQEILKLFKKTIMNGGGVIYGVEISQIVANCGLGMLPEGNNYLGRLQKEFPEWEISKEKAFFSPETDYRVRRKSGIPELKEPELESFLVEFTEDGKIIRFPIS